MSLQIEMTRELSDAIDWYAFVLHVTFHCRMFVFVWISGVRAGLVDRVARSFRMSFRAKTVADGT